MTLYNLDPGAGENALQLEPGSGLTASLTHGVLALDVAATQKDHHDDLLAVANHGLPKIDIVAGGNGESTVTGMTATDTLVACIVFTVEADTGTSASGDKVSAVTAATAPACGAGKVTYTGDLSGDTLMVVWIDHTA